MTINPRLSCMPACSWAQYYWKLVKQMVSMGKTKLSYSVNISDIATNVVLLCSVYITPSNESDINIARIQFAKISLFVPVR